MPETLGERLKKIRRALGLTQEILAKPEFSKSLISRFEHNRTRPSVSTLERLAKRLKQPVSYFLGEADEALSQKVLAVLDGRGAAHLTRRGFEAALAVFTEMRDLAASTRNAEMALRAALGLGEALVGLHRPDEARPHFDDALDRARTAEDALGECRALHGLAQAEYFLGRFPRGAQLYEAALTIAATLGGREAALHGEIVLYYGGALLRMGRLGDASEAFAQSQRIFEEARLPERVGEALVDQGLVLYLGGDYDGALLQLEQARVLLEQYEDLRVLAWARNNLGMVLLEIGRSREALEHFSVSLTIKQRLQDAVGECHTLTELARCHFACGEIERAREYAEQAVARSRNGGAPDEEARAQIVLGAIARVEGNARKAQRYLVLAAEHCERASMTLELVTVFRQLAGAALALGRHKEASGYHEKVFAALRGMKPHDAAAALRAADVVAKALRTAALPKGRPDTERT